MKVRARAVIVSGAFAAQVNDGFARGGVGAGDLADAVVQACEEPNSFKHLYDDEALIQDKIETVAKHVHAPRTCASTPRRSRGSPSSRATVLRTARCR
jgi:formyltetrahydrofolate synthetase